MPSIHIAKIALTIKARLPREALQQHFPAPVETLGEQLAQQCMDYTQRQSLGYFPALEFFQEQGGIDTYLLDAVGQISLLAVTMTKQEVSRVLQPLFSSVNVGIVQSLAYTMPMIRPSQPQAKKMLAEHYLPDKVKFEVVVTLLQKKPAESGIENAARQIALRWLDEIFPEVEVTSARLLKEQST
jgi:hypothetical protein